MGKRLRDNISSRYFEAANRLNSKAARRKIVAYVESYDDVYFWRTVLAPLESDKMFFQITLPTRATHLERGKKAVLMSLLADKVGAGMIACVDADYDYLVQGRSYTSQAVLNNPYVFHTYAYAIENLQCYAPSLHETCVAITLNDHQIFDFEEFFKQFSQTVFPLFVWSIWYYRTPNYGEFTITSFLRVIELGNFRIDYVGEMLHNLRRKVDKKVEYLQHRNPDARQSYQQVKEDLKRLGVTPDTTYLYIQGHHLFNKVVVPMLNKVCDRLVRERENEINHQSMHSTQRKNELSCYTNSLGDVVEMLKKSNGYMASEPFKWMEADLRHFVAHLLEEKKAPEKMPEQHEQAVISTPGSR